MWRWLEIVLLNFNCCISQELASRPPVNLSVLMDKIGLDFEGERKEDDDGFSSEKSKIVNWGDVEKYLVENFRRYSCPFKCMYVVCMYIYICIYRYVCMYVYVRMYYIYVLVCMYSIYVCTVCMRLFKVCKYIYFSMCVCTVVTCFA